MYKSLVQYNLDSEIENLRITAKFLKIILDKSIKIMEDKFVIPEKRKKQLRWNRMEWVTRNFFINLAKGNIDAFCIKRFVNNLIPDDQILQILERLDGKKRWSNDSLFSDSSGSENELSPRFTSEPDSEIRPESKIVEKTSRSKKILEYDGLKVFLSATQYKLLGDKYRYIESCKKEIIFGTAFRYQTLGADNFHLAMPASVVQLVEFECFGSPFNTQKPYFSAFPEVDCYFGSWGNFFRDPIPLTCNIISFNPPFDEEIFKMAANSLIAQMRTRKGELTVICTLPVWDPETQDKHNFYRDKKFEGKKFEGLDILKASGLIKESIVLTKDEAPFYDYVTKKYVHATNIHLLICATGMPRVTLSEVIKKWKEAN